MKSPRSRRKGAPHSEGVSKAAPETIFFYRANEKPYGVFSNLFRRAIMFEGREYATSEHAYQAGKARKEQVRDWILSAPTPGLVAMAAHGLYTWDITPDWSRTKYDRMRKVLRAKFTQHDDLREILLATGKARLVEAGTVANAVNLTWGEVSGKGKNMLGIMLMELREALRAEATSVKAVPAARSRAARTAATGWHKGNGAVTA
jgi:ribA/ribD-fused uncharacterized protein